MKKVFILIIISSLFFLDIYSQGRGLFRKPVKNTESSFSASDGEDLPESTGSVILSTGVAYCAGDAWASPFSKSIANGCNYDLSIGYRHMFPKNIGFRIVLQHSNYASDDGDGKHHGVGLYRSTSNVYELTGRVEQQFIFGPKYSAYKRNSVYAFFGGGVIYGKLNYPQEAFVGFPDFTAGVITFGMGYTYDISKKFFIGTEFTLQYALTDKVDGYPLTVKQGTQVFNDVMGNFNITFGYRIFGN